MRTLLDLTDEQLGYYARTYSVNNSCTAEQLDLIVDDIQTSYYTTDQAIAEMHRLGEKFLKYTWAGMQFPCKLPNSEEGVTFGVVRRFRQRADDILTQMTNLRQKCRDHDRDYEFDVVMMELVDEYKNRKKTELVPKWDAIKYDMYPPAKLSAKIAEDHDDALRMNQQFDREIESAARAARISNVLAAMPDEDRELLVSMMKV